MTSPDVSRYVDLSIYDDNPASSLNDILSHIRGTLPEWSPRAGQIETVLAEAIAVRSAELSAAINRVPSATAEVLLKLFGLERSDGAKATATLTITFTDSDVVARTLPQGSEFIYYSASSGKSFTYTLDEDFTLSGTLSGTAAVTAKSVGSSYNLVATGQNLIIVNGSSFFSSAVFATNPSGGSDAESDDQYFTRGAALLASYTTASTTASQIKAYVGSTKSYADRVEVYNRRRYRDRDTTGVSYTTHDGYALIAVAGFVTSNATAATDVVVGASNLADLYNTVTDRAPAGLIVDVMSAELAAVDVTIDLKAKFGYVFASVEAAVLEALREYLNPNTWDWGQNRVRINEIISLVDTVEGVDYVETVKFNGSSLVGTENVGYYGLSGGSSASAVFDISGATDGTIPAGSAYYYIDSTNPENPEIYTFTLNSDTTISSGAASSVAATAINVGANYNDEDNGGVIPGVGTGGAEFVGAISDYGTATQSSGEAVFGGSDSIERFTPFPVASAVESDTVLRNLGTLVTYGNLVVNVT